jgi:hypothetical protein
MKVRAAQSAPEPKPRLKPIAWADLQSLPKRESLIGGLLDCAAMSVVFGGTNTGKTFVALHMAAHVALGWPWCERTIRRGAVLYLAAEGGLGIQERLTAFRIHHDVDVATTPLYVIPEPINLCRTTDDTTLLLQRIDALPWVDRLELIVVDTLSRTLSGGDENSPADMGAFVRNCDRLRLHTGAHVLAIHHTGKNADAGARGHSLLKAAADTEIEVTKSEAGIVTATVSKQRDHRSGDVFAFGLEPVSIGQQDDGADVTSCVAIPSDIPVAQAKRGSLPKAAQTCLRALAEVIEERGEPAPALIHIPNNVLVVSTNTWREQAYRRGISTSDEERAKQQAFKRASEYLIGASRVGTWDGLVWLTA